MAHFLVVLITLFLAVPALATEEAKYKVVSSDGNVEIRRYEPQILAEVIIQGDIGEASNRAFRPLFNYISGDNQTRSGDSQKIAMTAPVSQRRAETSEGLQIAMTAPVSVQSASDQDSNLWAVSFMMPADFTMENTPLPTNANVSIREVPARLVAAIKYSGTWSAKRYQRNKGELQQWLQASQFEANGEPVWARYNSPMSLPFLRRNEVLIPVVEK